MSVKQKLLILLFFISIGVISYLQFTSYSNMETLRLSNRDLIEEMEFSNNIQFFQTHFIVLNDALSSPESIDIDVLEKENKILKLTYNYITTYLKFHHADKSSLELDSFVSKVLNLSENVLEERKSSGKLSTELNSEIVESIENNDLIIDKLYELEEMTEELAMKKSDRILDSEKKSQKLNIGLGLISLILIALSVFFIIIQIKKQHHLIADLNLANEKEKKSSRIKDDFLANMSHEIRTPLNAILGFSNNLAKEVHTDQVRSMVQAILEAGTQLLSVVNQILDISKLDREMVKIELAPFELKELISKIESRFRPAFEAKNLDFKINYNENSHTRFLGDEHRLIQILTNLLSNAEKFTSIGNICLDITVENNIQNSKNIMFKVSDTGIGIAADKLDFIFERFEQAESSTTRQYGGTGLGLAIVKELVHLLQGTIEVQSELDKGSTFLVSIPLLISEKLSNEHAKSPTPQTISISDKTKILIVEDNPLNMKLIQAWFDIRNLAFYYAENGIQAIEKLKYEQYDCILMDIQMPMMDGYQCTEMIRNQLKLDIPIIGMSAHSLQKDKDKAIDSGMNAYLTKPIIENELFEMISRFSSISSAKLVDETKLESMSSGNSDFIKMFLKEFLTITLNEIEKLKLAFQSENLKEVKFIAHTLKTNFSYLGTENIHLSYFESLESAEEFASLQIDFYAIIFLFSKVKIKVEEILKNQ